MFKRLKVKVCGLRDPSNIQSVASTGPDLMGFIFYPPSPRYVGDYFSLEEPLPGIDRVGVFVNAAREEIVRRTGENRIGIVQLHGDESPAFCAEVKALGLTVIKAFRIATGFDLNTTKQYEGSCDFFLFDTAGKHYGGNGEAFDWRLLEKYSQSVPFFLSGGISPENIEAISSLRSLNLYGVDVNSGVEHRPALKDVSKVANIIRAINGMCL